MSIFRITQLDALFRKTFEVWLLVLVTYHQIFIHYYVSTVILFIAYLSWTFFLKYDLLDLLMPYILLFPFPGALMYPCIITMRVNDKTDNSLNVFAHLHCLLHLYVLSYTIPSFVNKFTSYIQWINFLICSHVVAAFWAESSENVSESPSSHLPHCLNNCDNYHDYHKYCLIWNRKFEAKCFWMNSCVKLLLQWFSIIMFYLVIITNCTHVFQVNTLTS